MYPPPNSTQDKYGELVSTVENLRSRYGSHELLIMGDYNLPKFTWPNVGEFSDSLFAYSYSEKTNVKERSEIVMNAFSWCGMKQYFPVHKTKDYTQD